MKLKNTLLLLLAVSLLLGVGTSARAFTQADANTAWQSYKQQFFYVINGSEGYFRNQQGGGNTTTTYQLAYDIEAAVDARDVTVVNQTINGFVALYGTNPASWDVAEDDNMTFALVFAAAYQLTGNPSHLAMAKSNFDTCYNRAWDSANGGGLMRIVPGVKSAQVNGPGCLAAYLIYQSGGGSAYLTKAQNIYNWMLANVWNASTGQVNATPGDTTNPLSADVSYFAACSYYLGYPANVTLAGNFVKNRWGTGMQGFGPGSFLGSVNSVNLRWLAKSGFDPAFLRACCDRGLTCMNTSGLVGPDFNQPTSNSPAYSFDCTNIIAGLMCAPPAIGPGTYALFVRSTNLALDANLAGTANGTPVVQSGYH
ncbi:MAG: glycoside hydrolase family 76, partial [Capsulimonas sp.]|nr:glycoside hydrolase family 76 [Capsulimonas sp.]